MRKQRRFIRWVLGAACSLAFLAIYHHFFGGIDGLPSLPERYLHIARPQERMAALRREDRTSHWLRQAFGEHCPEVRYNHHLRIQANGLIFAFHDYRIVEGKFVVAPFSLAMMGRTDPRTGFPEIYTLHCDEARLTFDRPVEAFADIARFKLKAAEFLASDSPLLTDPRAGKIHVTFNHGTPETNDDLVAVTPGPIRFEDRPDHNSTIPHVWTDQGIEATDWHSNPPALLRAETFSLFLEPETLRNDRRSGDLTRHPSGIRLVVLRNVFLQLPMEFSTSFAGSRPERFEEENLSSPVFIRTLGELRFDVRQMTADLIAAETENLRRSPVSVVRRLPAGAEELECDRLSLAFGQDPTSRSTGEGTGLNSTLQIRTIRASGDTVLLRSAVERFEARGRELIVKPKDREVTLRGQPATATKEGHVLQGSELIVRPPPASTDQPFRWAVVPGPGRLILNEGRTRSRLELTWHDEFTLERDGTGDRLRVRGDVIADDHTSIGQKLKGDQLVLRFRPQRRDSQTPGPAVDTRPATRRIESIEISGSVHAESSDLVVEEASRVVIWIHETEVSPSNQPDALTFMNKGPGVRDSEKSPARPSQPTQHLSVPETTESKRPLRIRAETIQAHVREDEDRWGLDRVDCRGDVQLWQTGSQVRDGDLRVAASHLLLTRLSDGDVLRLHGMPGKPARVHVQEMSIAGPQIEFDPQDNRVEIMGAGQADLQVSTNLSGEKLATPSHITVVWNGQMEFRANRVSFDGGVHARQDSRERRDGAEIHEWNRLTCRRLDIYLDRSVNLSTWNSESRRESLSAEQRPKIRRVVCHPTIESGQSVPVELIGQALRNGHLTRSQRILANEIVFDNDTGEIVAQASEGKSGEFRLFQAGHETTMPEELIRSAATTAESSSGQLIQVRFRRSLRANHKTQAMAFGDLVTATYSATADDQATVNPESLPVNAFLMRCRNLEVSLVRGSGRRFVTMLAEGKAEIEGSEFSGQADVIKYDESKKQLVIFDSVEGNPVTLHYAEAKGREPLTVRGRTIYYWQATREFRGVGLIGAEGQQRPRGQPQP